MPSGLKRFQRTRDLHFITFSCHGRTPLLGAARARDTFESTLERVRRWYGFFIVGYVVMPEHVHLLVSEPERGSLALAVQMLKQLVSRKLRATTPAGRFWEPRYYDFNVWSEPKRIEKLRYLHRNPATRGLVSRPEDWAWSSFRAWASGVEGVVEVESRWTARKRERARGRSSARTSHELQLTHPSLRERVGHPATICPEARLAHPATSSGPHANSV